MCVGAIQSKDEDSTTYVIDTALGKYCSLQSGLKYLETFFFLNQLLKKGAGGGG
jgi:hypothetical protein